MFGQFKRVMVGMAVLTLAITPSLVSACGGFFGPAGLAVDLNAFRVAFSVTKDHAVTEEVDINYTGKAADFSWIMPLPAVPTVDVAEPGDLDTLQSATSPTLDLPPNYCSNLNTTPTESGGWGGGGGSIGTVGPYDYAIIKNDNPGQLVKWLRDHGYTIQSNDEPIINQYIREGSTFVAMRLKPGAGVQDIQPVVFRYKSDKITIPVRMGAVASSATVPILAWIFSDTQYAPTNYTRVDRPSLADARAYGESLRIGDPISRPYNPSEITDASSVYSQGVTTIQKHYNGHAFITELAEPTKDLAALSDSGNATPEPLADSMGPVLKAMMTDFPYVTRLSAHLAPNQMTLDPLFAPLPGAPDVPLVIDIGKQVDPLALYGCTTREALDPRIASEFAASHTTFSNMRFDVGHPANWVLSEFPITFNGENGTTHLDVYAFAPQPVTAQTVDTYFKGGATPPMFVFSPVYFYDQVGLGACLNQLNQLVPDGQEEPNFGSFDPLFYQVLGQTPDFHGDGIACLPTPVKNLHSVENSFWPYRAAEGDKFTVFDILASKAQWQSNQSLFDDMMAYARSHQYFTGADTRDTLFLKVGTAGVNPHASSRGWQNDLSDVYSIPLPKGWTAQLDDQHDIVIALSGSAASNVTPVATVSATANPPISTSSVNGPAMRMTFVGDVGGATGYSFEGYIYHSNPEAASTNATDYHYPADTVQRALRFYGLPGSPNDVAITAVTQHCAVDPTDPQKAVLKPVAFHSDGRTGLVVLSDEYIVGVYAPDAEYSQYQAVLQKMMDAYVAGYNCGAPPPQLADDVTATPDVTATAVICPNSPTPRLVVGGQGVVTPGAPDNLRSAPQTDSGIFGQIPAGGRFTVLKGPACDSASGLAWWQVKFNGQTGWLAEGQGQTYFVSPVAGTGQAK